MSFQYMKKTEKGAAPYKNLSNQQQKYILKVIEELPGISVIGSKITKEVDQNFQIIIPFAKKIIEHRKRNAGLYFLVEIDHCPSPTWIPEDYFSSLKNLVFDYFKKAEGSNKIRASKFWHDYEDYIMEIKKTKKKQSAILPEYQKNSFLIPCQEVSDFVSDSIDILGAAVKDESVIYQIQNCKNKKKYWITSDNMKKYYPKQLIQFLEQYIQL